MKWAQRIRAFRKRHTQTEQRVVFVALSVVFVVCGVTLLLTKPQPSPQLAVQAGFPAELRKEYTMLTREVQALEDQQTRSHAHLVGDAELQQQLSRIQVEAASGWYHQAKASIAALRTQLAEWRLMLGTTEVLAPTEELFIPIVLYHYTPPDFEQQLMYLEQQGYTPIDMNQVLAGLHGGPLPAKPVALTFDDGFANQLEAFEVLKRRQVRATFYIINGGSASAWCIGASRRYGDPLQPSDGCGDAYLNWNQIRMMDRSGLVVMGGHTLDHLSLGGLPADLQRSEIVESKAELERQLGHSVRHFAYPTGSYDDTTLELVKEAGYLTAVTTLPGTYQPPGAELTLRRIRDAYSLP